MVNFQELDEDEFDKYIVDNWHTEEGCAFGLQKNLDKDLTYIDRQFNVFSKELPPCREYMEMGMYDSLQETVLKLSQKVLKLSKFIAGLAWKYAGADRRDVIKNVIIEDKNVSFTYLENGIIIKLPELLPHKPTVNVYDHSVQYYYDTDTWRESYYAAFRKEFENGKMKLFEKKAIIIIKHHVSNKKAGDIDNFDTKVIIDIVTDFLLIDDDHKYVCLFMDMVEDETEEEYTEIIVCAMEDRDLFIT